MIYRSLPLWALLLVGTVLACSSPKETSDGEVKKVEEGGIPKVRKVQEETWKKKSSDPFRIRDLALRGETLQLIVRYSGGCEEHNFDLWASPFAEKSDPPRRKLFLKHDANGDACRSVIDDTLRWDLDPIERPTILSIDGHQEEIAYGTE